MTTNPSEIQNFIIQGNN